VVAHGFSLVICSFLVNNANVEKGKTENLKFRVFRADSLKDKKKRHLAAA